MPEPSRIFVSATSRGLRSARIAVATHLRQRGYEPIVQEEFECDAQQIRHLIRDQLAPADAVVLLVGPAYGFEPRDWPADLPRRSYTQLEYDLALELSKPVYRFFATENCPLDPFAPEPGEHRQRQAEYLRSLKHGDYVWYEFGSIDALLRQVGNTRFHRAVRPNLPFASLGSLFKGRDEVLARIRQTLLTRPAQAAAVTARQAIHGLGGVGKTRLALEYAHRYASEYSARLHVTSDSPASLKSNLAALCRTEILDLPEKAERDQQVQVEAVLRWLRLHAGWLLILDNVDTSEAQIAVQGMLDKTTTGHVLITSRRSELWSTSVATIELDTLSLSASTEFLLERTAPNPAAPTTPHRRTTSNDASDAEALARKLDGLALALEQAGAYIATNRITFGDYRQRLGDTESEVMTWFDESLTHYPRSVALTWQASVNQLYDDGQRMLHLLAWLAPAPIPVEMIRAQPTGDEPVHAPIRNRERALADLAAYSLAKWTADGTSITVHRLVQDVTRQQLSPTQRTGCLTDALNLVQQHSQTGVALPDDVRSWSVWTPLVPHATVVARHGDLAQIPLPTATLMNHVGLYHHTRSQFDLAEPLLRRSLAIQENYSGQENPDFTAMLNNLAMLLASTNRYAEAEQVFRRALALNEAGYGDNHPSVARMLNNLATVLLATHQTADIEAILLRAQAIYEHHLGPDHPDVALTLNHRALFLVEINRSAEVEPTYQRVIAIFEASLGPDHPHVAIALANLAEFLRHQNRVDEAIAHLQRAQAIFEGHFGAHHPRVATALTSLAVLLGETPQLDQAEALHRRALAIDEAAFGADHPDVARDLNNLALFLHRTGRNEEAEPILRRALAINENSYGPVHPDVAYALSNLAEFLGNTKRPAEAEQLFRRAIGCYEQAFGSDHPRVAVVLSNFGEFLRRDKRPHEAEPLLRRALEMSESNLVPNHPDTAIRLNNLALVLYALQRHSEAEELLRRAVAIDAASATPESPQVVTRMYNLARLLMDQNQHDEAEQLYERGLLLLHRFGCAAGQAPPNFQAYLESYFRFLATARGIDDQHQLLARFKDLLGLPGE